MNEKNYGLQFVVLAPDQVPRIAGCLQRLADHHNAVNTLKDIHYPPYTIESEITRIAAAVAAGKSMVMTLCDEEQVAGFVKLSFEEMDGVIDCLYLDPAFRRRGLGEKLINWAIDEFKKRGLTYANLRVIVGNDAKAFYERCGFRDRAYYMMKKL